MLRSLASATLLVLLGTSSVSAASIYAEVDGVAQFPRSIGGFTERLTHGSALPNGGRAFDFGAFSHGGGLCQPFTGQVDYLCASASARVEIDRELVATSTYVGVATHVRLKAKAQVEYRNVPGYLVAQIWGRATIHFPIACHGFLTPPVTGLDLRYRLTGDHAVSSSDPALKVEAPRPFETCDPGGVCVIRLPDFRCPDEGATATVTVDLFPRIRIENPQYHEGWTVLGVSDYSHTFTVEGMDVLDANGDPMPGVRAVVPDGAGGANDIFLTGAEYEEIAESTTSTTTTVTTSTTTTTVPGGGTTTTIPVAGTTTTSTAIPVSSTTTTVPATGTTSTTSTTLPPCAGEIGAPAARCHCDLRPVAGCEGVVLKGPIAKGVKGLCTTVGKAVVASGKKQVRLTRRAAALAKRTLAKVNGRKGAAVADACRNGLRTFVGAVQTDLATTP
ncbi:MAG: hypothetical protein KIT14_01790 [bacterium]|nr:hypothetical protein [bacterium]